MIFIQVFEFKELLLIGLMLIKWKNQDQLKSLYKKISFHVFHSRISIPSSKETSAIKDVINEFRNRMFKEKINAFTQRSSTRFLKHKNIVESNKENAETTRFNSSLRESILPLGFTNMKQSTGVLNRSIGLEKQSMRNTERVTFTPVDALIKHKHNILFPKAKEKILTKHNQIKNTQNNNKSATKSDTNNVFSQENKSLQRLLKKNKLYEQRCLVGMNIPKIQQAYSFSRFDLYNLYSYYKTLLQSTHSLQDLRKGFQNILYISKIELNSEIISTMFQAFCTEISFPNFIKIYGNIQNLLFTQTITEQMKAVFRQFYKEEELTADKVLETLKLKMDVDDASEIRKILFEHYNRKDEGVMMSLNQILKACNQNLAICKRIFNAINKPSAGNRISSRK